MKVVKLPKGEEEEKRNFFAKKSEEWSVLCELLLDEHGQLLRQQRLEVPQIVILRNVTLALLDEGFGVRGERENNMCVHENVEGKREMRERECVWVWVYELRER